MTTKHKIIAGFVSMMAIIVATSVLGYRALDASMAGLQEYRRFARINVNLSDALVEFNEASIRMNMLLMSSDNTFLKGAQDALDRMEKNLEAATKEIADPQRLEATNQLRKYGDAYRAGAIKLSDSLTHMMEQFKSRVIPSKNIMAEAMSTMMKAARENNNAEILFLLSGLGLEVADLRFSMASYSFTRSEDHAKTALASVAAITSIMERMQEFLRSQEGREAHGKMVAALKVWAEAIASMIEAGRAANVALTELANNSGQALTEIVELASVNSSVVASIATAAEEQSATSEEINHAVEEINRIVAETADGMVQASAAVQELSRMAQELNRVMEGLKA